MWFVALLPCCFYLMKLGARLGKLGLSDLAGKMEVVRKWGFLGMPKMEPGFPFGLKTKHYILEFCYIVSDQLQFCQSGNLEGSQYDFTMHAGTVIVSILTY